MFIKRKDKIDLKKHVADLEYRLCRVEKEFRQLKCEHKEVDYIFDETWGHDDIYYKRCKNCNLEISFSSEEEWLKEKITYEKEKVKEEEAKLRQLKEKTEEITD
jgi:hypothetical protein